LDSINFDWYDFVEKLINTKVEEGCKPFLTALESVKQGDVSAAVAALQDLNELQYLLSVVILEIEYVKLGNDPCLLPLFTAALREKMTLRPYKLPDFYHKIEAVWSKEVGVLLSDNDIIYRNKYQRGSDLLFVIINERCRTGLYSEALPLVNKINSYYRERLSETWVKVISGLPEGNVKEQALMTLAKIGECRPLIRDGGEEAGAFANAIKGFSDLGLDSEHPAVQVSFKGLLKLSSYHAPEDVRSFGTFTAQVAAAKVAGRLKHDGWFEIAKALANNIYDEHLKQRANVVLKLAEFHRLEKPITELHSIIESVGLICSSIDNPLCVLNNYIDIKPLKKVSPDEELANAIIAGKDMTAEVALRMVKEDTENRNNNSIYNRFILGCELCLSDEQLDEIYNILDWWNDEALVKGALRLSERQPERVLKYLNRGYPKGDRDGVYTEQLLPILNAELLIKAEKYFIERKETKPLVVFTAHHALKGNFKRAALFLRYLGKTTSAKDWIPSYRRGNNTGNKKLKVKPLPYLDEISDIKSSIKACTTTALLLQLVIDHWQDKQLVQAVLKAVKLKKYQKSFDDRCALIKLYLFVDEVETALTLLPSVNTGHKRRTNVEYGVEPIEDILSFLVKSPEKLTLNLFNTLLTEMSKILPQWIWMSYFSLARLSCHLPKSEQIKAQEDIVKTVVKPNNSPCDNIVFYLGFLKGTLEVDGYNEPQSEQLEAWFTQVKYLSKYRGREIGIVWIMFRVAELKVYLPSELWEKLSVDIFIDVPFNAYGYEALYILEKTLFYFWSMGDLKLMKALIKSNKLPEHLQYDLYRSIWKEIHLAPSPYEVLALTKPDLQMTLIFKKEFTESLCSVMVEHQHPDAQRIQGLLQSMMPLN